MYFTINRLGMGDTQKFRPRYLPREHTAVRCIPRYLFCDSNYIKAHATIKLNVETCLIGDTISHW